MDHETYLEAKGLLLLEWSAALAHGNQGQSESAVHAIAMLENAYEAERMAWSIGYDGDEAM